MVPRTSSHGKFWGCPAYPDCRGTRNSMGAAQNRFESEAQRSRWTSEDEDRSPSERYRDNDRRRW
jgi:ssDNA-binding Zn-finger/Zn-ribbon topoisomerase 1